MNYEQLQKEYQKIIDLQNTALQKRIEWLKYLLTVCIAFFGALVSLHPKSPDTLLLRWCFSISTVLLSGGILLLSVVLYSLYELYSTVVRKAQQELSRAIDEMDIPSCKGAFQAKGYVFCRNIGYIFLLLSVISYSIYIVLSAFS